MTLANNLYYGTNTSGWHRSGTTYADFAAWNAAGLESGAVWGDPLFTSPGAGGTCTWSPPSGTGPQPCPQAYTLKTGSPALGARCLALLQVLEELDEVVVRAPAGEICGYVRACVDSGGKSGWFRYRSARRRRV